MSQDQQPRPQSPAGSSPVQVSPGRSVVRRVVAEGPDSRGRVWTTYEVERVDGSQRLQVRRPRGGVDLPRPAVGDDFQVAVGFDELSRLD